MKIREKEKEEKRKEKKRDSYITIDVLF
jgi:hypothetical protein